MKIAGCLKSVYLMLVFAVAVCGAFAGNIEAGIIYESAELGSTGLTGGSVSSIGYKSNNSTTYYAGARFHLDYEAEVTAIGGHFYLDLTSNGNLFGAIISLSGPDVYPSSVPFETLEVMASTVFVPNYPSTDYRTALSVTLDPGDYAVVFGTGELGASGGFMRAPITTLNPGNEGDIINWNDTIGWSSGSAARYAVEGTVFVPEPATILLVGLGGMLLRKRL